MRRPSLRLLVALTGLSLLVVHLAVAVAGYRLLVELWARRPDPLRLAAYFLAATLVVGYLSYRLGTAGLLRELEATEVGRREAPRLHERLDRLRTSFDVGEVRLHVATLEAPNALAVGTAGGGAVVLDRRLPELLTPAELEAILAHELAHLEGRDGLIQTLGYTLVRSVGGVLYLLLLPLGLLVGGLVRAVSWAVGRPPRPLGRHLAVVRGRVLRVVVVVLFALTLPLRALSRRREYRADDRAVEATGDPAALARALAKIRRAAAPGWGMLSPLYVHGDEEGLLTRLLATHPPMDERVGRLLEMADQPRRRPR